MNSGFNQMFILNAIGRLFAHCWMRGDPASYIMVTSHQLFMEISRVWLQVGVVLDGSSPSTELSDVQEATLCNSVRYGKPMGRHFMFTMTTMVPAFMGLLVNFYQYVVVVD